MRVNEYNNSNSSTLKACLDLIPSAIANSDELSLYVFSNGHHNDGNIDSCALKLKGSKNEAE